MTARPTAEIVADLRERGSLLSSVIDNEAADRFTELDALRPPCPTCGGSGYVGPFSSVTQQLGHCPDCVDGKVSVEQLAATWRAVHNRALIWPYPADGAIDYLRAVKP